MVFQYIYSSAELKSAEQHLQVCEAIVSPALATISAKIDEWVGKSANPKSLSETKPSHCHYHYYSARMRLQAIMDNRMAERPSSSTVTDNSFIVTVMKALSLDRDAVDHQLMNNLENESAQINKEATVILHPW